MMSYKKTILMAATITLALSLGIVQGAEEEVRSYLGVRLDTSPLPEILVKHLCLKPDEGLLIKNIQVGSPADKAGLERDDIIIAFGEKTVTNFEEFVNDIQQAGVGAEVKVGYIHMGQRLTKTVKLEEMTDKIEWKYPEEVYSADSWRPGKVFQLKPGAQNWQSVPFNQMPGRNNIKRYFQEKYYYQHTPAEGESYEITIDGDPNNPQTFITVRVGSTEYKTTTGQIDKLPKEYQEAAREALENARETSRQSLLNDNLQNDWFYSTPSNSNLWQPYGRHPFGPGGDLFEQMQRQMQELQERMMNMERMNQNLFEHLPDQTPDEHSKTNNEGEEL